MKKFAKNLDDIKRNFQTNLKVISVKTLKKLREILEHFVKISEVSGRSCSEITYCIIRCFVSQARKNRSMRSRKMFRYCYIK